MKKYDFIIGYEHKNREIESVCLLKCELERRGYSVLIYCLYDARLKEYINKYEAEVLILPYCYDNQSLLECVQEAIKFRKLVNLQWEQAIYRQQEENKDSFKNPSGLCKKALHLSWGQANVDRLVKIANIDEKNVSLVGNITLDFLKEPLTKYYLSKQEISDKYNIPKDKKICLFIASFKSATLSEAEVEELCKIYGEWRREHHKIAKKTMNTILEWIQKALDENPDIYFIYRPHPGENTELVSEIARRNNRFLVIGDLSIKQWIVIADKIYAWMSTSIVEVFFAHKDCEILSPYELDKEANAKLFDDARTIKSMQEFLETINIDSKGFPVSKNAINDYYLIDNQMSYLKIVDVLQNVYSNTDFIISKEEFCEFYKLLKKPDTLVKRITTFLWQIDFFYWVFWQIAKLPIHTSYFEQKRKEKKLSNNLLLTEFVSFKEIEIICKKIRECISVK